MNDPKELALPKAFEAKDHEDGISKLWEDSGAYNPDNLAADDPYTIILPPPNATGTLHLGHAMYVVQDILIRYHRMLGKKTLWLPGTDHAAIATQNRVEKNLAQRTPAVTRQQLGREAFLKEVDAFVEQSRGTIKHQLHKMGFSLDWSREAFTLDAARQTAVSELFVRMYNDGLIYRGHRIVNWCPRCQSTLADDEVEYKEETTKFYYFKFGPVIIGTARPETKFLDKTIVVNPSDERYTALHNKTFELEWLTGPIQANVIADEVVDTAFGTGAMTITPAHSMEDFALAQKYDLPIVQIIDEAGNFTEAAGEFAGKNARASRDTIVELLNQKGLVDHIDEEYKHNLSVCYRCGTAIEPLTKVQWFVNVDHALPKGHKFAGLTLKQVANQVVQDKQIEIIPERFTSTYFHWMENLHDWCISRQLWYGHRIPAWYKDGEVKVQLDAPGEGWTQDDDVLDTWFSSGMWTFSTLGWPNQTDDLKRFHPTQVLETGYDILFFWVARMILMTTYALEEVPFEHVYLHGLVRDKQGRKMSKSLGNGIDPLEMSAKYGTDALRVALIAGTTPGNDSRLYEEKIASYRNFVNKIWNVARFVLMQPPVTETKVVDRTLTDRWFESRLAKATAEVTQHIEQYQFSLAAERAYDFLWHEFADWYVEVNKFQSNPALVRKGLATAMQLLHPIVPFVTETIWQQLNPGELLMIARWPKEDGTKRDAQAETAFGAVQDAVTQLRNLRGQYKIPYTKPFTVYTQQSITDEAKLIIEQMCKVQVSDGQAGGQATEVINAEYHFTVSLGDLIDVEAEKKRLQKELEKLEKVITNQQQRLSNQDFVSRAPAQIIEKERALLLQTQTEAEVIKASLQKL